MREDITTTDLAEICAYPRERRDLIELLTAWDRQGLPSDFYEDEVTAMFNRNSGNVFLTNSEYQCAMMNGNKLDMWHTCRNCGHEGFEEDCQINDDGCNECNPNDEEDDE